MEAWQKLGREKKRKKGNVFELNVACTGCGFGVGNSRLSVSDYDLLGISSRSESSRQCRRVDVDAGRAVDGSARPIHIYDSIRRVAYAVVHADEVDIGDANSRACAIRHSQVEDSTRSAVLDVGQLVESSARSCARRVEDSECEQRGDDDHNDHQRPTVRHQVFQRTLSFVVKHVCYLLFKW